MRIFLRVVSLFWIYRWRAVLAYLCLFGGAGLAVLIPRLTGDGIDMALGSANGSALALVATAVVGAGVLRSIVSFWQNFLAEYLSQKVAYDLRRQFYDRLQSLSYSFHDNAQTGQLMSRATSDIDGIRQFVGFALIRGVYFLVLMVAVTVLMVSLNWKLALISLTVIPFISYRTISVNRQLMKLWDKIQQGIGVLETLAQENLTGVRVVRAFAREKQESKKFSAQAETIFNQEIEVNNLLAANSPIMTLAISLAMGGIIWYGGTLVIDGALTPGELAQFLLYLVLLNMPIRMLGWLAILFSRAHASGQRVFEILDQVSPVKEKADALAIESVNGLVRFENVSFGYDSHGDVLKEMTFEAKPGMVVALVGASGSGKSTVANLIPRFYDVTGGRITVDGRDIKDLKLAALRKHVGIIHQDTFLFSATIAENIRYGKPNASLEEVTEAAKSARLHNFIVSLPSGYNTLVGERGITLSGGQKQRLAIARTILLNPRILIMDDSTSNVDTETEYLIQHSLTDLLAGRTTFIIAHRIRSVQMADLIIVLKDGQIVERGTHTELLEKNGLYKQIYTLQFQNQEEAAGAVLAAGKLGEPQAADSGAQSQPVSMPGQLSSSVDDDEEAVYGKVYDSRVFSRVFKYFAPYKVVLPIVITATLFFTLSSVLSPYLVGLATDNYITAGDKDGLLMIVLFFLGNALLNWAAYYAQIKAEARLGQGILLTLRNQLFEHLQRLPLRFYDTNKVGRILSRLMNDVGELAEFLDSGAFWVAGEIVSLIAVIVMLLVMDYKLALLTLTVLPILVIFIGFWQRKARKYFVGVRQAISRVNSALQENITGVRVIQSLSREDLNSRHFDDLNRANFNANIASTRLSAMMTPVVETLMASATAVIILYGGSRVLEGTMLVGLLLAFLLYIQRFFEPIRNMTMQYTQLQRTMVSGTRLFELLDVEEEKQNPDAIKVESLSGDISFENVSFSYDNKIEILHSINLKIPAGTTIALVGPTGAGKSTIINLIARFYDVTAGRILIDSYDLRQLDRTAYRAHIGLVLQEPFLFSETVKENIRYGRLEATDEEVMSAAKAIGAHEFILGLENGYDTMLQERGQNLSMGQRQLISFARAILSNPKILLLDEATASVDSQTEHLLQEGMKQLVKGRTTVIIAHRLSTVRDADMIAVIEQGRISEQGKHEELLAKAGSYARLYSMNYAPVGMKV